MWSPLRKLFAAPGVASWLRTCFPLCPFKRVVSKYSPTKIMKTSFCYNLQKKVFMCFYANLGRHFVKLNNVGGYFCPDFQGFWVWFSANQNYCGCAWNPCIPTSNTTAFLKSSIGNFMVYQDRLETNLLQLFRHSENSEWFFIISVIIFWGQHCCWIETNVIGNDFFISFHCPQLLYCSPFPTEPSPESFE